MSQLTDVKLKSSVKYNKLMNAIKEAVTAIEELWLDELHGYCEKSFASVNVPSHDHRHHFRVWQLAKELILELSESGHSFRSNELQNLIIAIFFHDLGMINTIDTKHGRESKRLCEDYFRHCNRLSNEDKELICDAVEHHDDKEYKNMVYSGQAQKELLSILCACDDLDAFGAIGVFRYIEIYTLRKTPIDKLAPLLIKNVSGRYTNFQRLYGHISTFHEHQQQRFEITHRFFQKLEHELTSGYDPTTTTGATGIYNHFVNDVINGSSAIEEISGYVFNTNDDAEVQAFFEKFENEIQS